MHGQPLSRRLTGICLLVAPAILAVGLAITPYPARSGTRHYLDTIAAHPTRTQVAAILIEISYVLLVPAVFGLIAHTAAAPRWLRNPGAVLAVVGTAILPGLLVTDIYDLALAQRLPRSTSVSVTDHASSMPAATVMSAPGAIGLALGTTLLVAAAWRARIAPAWAAPLVIIGYAVGRQLAPAPAIIGGVLLLAGYGAVGLRMVTAPRPPRDATTDAPTRRRPRRSLDLQTRTEPA